MIRHSDAGGATRTRQPDAVRIAAIAYALPSATATVRDLALRGQITSDPALLEEFGFERVHTALAESPYELALRAGQQLIGRADIDPADVGLLVHGGPQGPTAFERAPSAATSSAAHRTTARFLFPGARLQHDLGLERAMVIGIDQLACTTLLGAVRVARALCLTENIDAALCTCAEFFPADAGREAIWNCTSDAAAAVLIRRGEGPLLIRAAHQVTKGYYWDADARRNELIAAYFPTARHVIERTLAHAGWDAGDVDWIIPHNVTRRSWDVLRSLCGLARVPIWDRNIARIGHTLAGDNLINLADALEAGDIRPGQKLLLFSYGYGAHWTALAVEA
ncbi:MAG TPA: 3-oxoacyl-[acyl-carrier-protein] synthase III C-terminal domain-containing protein [Longimicrobiales bacterium]